ncbi:MAG: VTT domain-containing protein [Clostridium sp.]|uniref:DedA family protein n=1 Tax=Clostridium sp. TaxID=1506 RepID=UPI002FC5D34F
MEQAIFNYAEYFATHNSLLSYVFFFINAVIQTLFPPYPGDTIIVFQGYLGSLSVFNNFIIVFSTLLGTTLSGVFLFLLIYKYGDKIISHKFFTKFFNISKVQGLKAVFEKYGPWLIVFNRFVPALGIVTVIAAGLFKVNKVKAVISIALAGIVHNMLLLTLGYTVGYNLPLIKEILFKFNKFFIILAALIGIVGFIVYKQKQKKIDEN